MRGIFYLIGLAALILVLFFSFHRGKAAVLLMPQPLVSASMAKET
jgi:hypothetical protein